MSCDRFSFIWDASVELILRYLPDTKIYLVTEERKYKHPQVTNIKVGQAMQDRDWETS